MARIEEFEDEDKEEKEEKEATSQSKDELPVDRDYYFEEVIDITVDYILGLDTHRVARR